MGAKAERGVDLPSVQGTSDPDIPGEAPALRPGEALAVLDLDGTLSWHVTVGKPYLITIGDKAWHHTREHNGYWVYQSTR